MFFIFSFYDIGLPFFSSSANVLFCSVWKQTRMIKYNQPQAHRNVHQAGVAWLNGKWLRMVEDDISQFKFRRKNERNVDCKLVFFFFNKILTVCCCRLVRFTMVYLLVVK